MDMGLICAGLLTPSFAFAESIPNIIPSAFRGNPVGLFWTIVLVGVVTAATVQWVKEFSRLRYNFHQRAVAWWIKKRANRYNSIERPMKSDDFEEIVSELKDSIDQQKALSELEELLSGEAENTHRPEYLAVYSLQAEQLCGQLSAAAEVAVATPNTYENLFKALAYSGRSSFRKDLLEYLRLVSQRQNSSNFMSRQEQRYGELRAQFMVQAQRALDGLQVGMGEQWRRKLIARCIVISFLVSGAVVAFLYMGDTSQNNPTAIESVGGFLIIGLAGTLTAPIAHDLMRAIRSFRRS